MFGTRIKTVIKVLCVAALFPLASCSKRIYKTKTIGADTVAVSADTKVRKDSATTDIAPRAGIPKAALFEVDEVLRRGSPFQGHLGFSALGRPVEAYYFPGKSSKRALIIGGVHGSELSSIEVANSIIKQLQKQRSYYTVIVIPCLFPDNAENARIQVPMIGTASNIGRYTNSLSADPNRQMPALGKPFDAQNPIDYLGRTIELENQMMLTLITQFQPTRIASLHAIRNTQFAGIYADPRTDSKGIALGYETDSSLAIEMASFIDSRGGHVRGNKLDSRPTAKYYLDPQIAEAGHLQVRNLNGSTLPNNKGKGASLGSWATTEVVDGTGVRRPAMRVITVEFPGSRRPEDYEDPFEKIDYQNMVDLYAAAVTKVFLEGLYLENEDL